MRGQRLIAALALLAAAPIGAQAPEAVPAALLVPGEVVERSLAGGGGHAYRIVLEAGQCAELVVEQSGVNVVAVVSDPQGRTLVRANNKDGAIGAERLRLIAEQAGEHRIELFAPNRGESGSYRARLVEVRAARDADRAFVAAQAASATASAAFSRGHDAGPPLAPAARRASLPRFDEAIALWRAAGDAEGEAEARYGRGLALLSLGDRRPARESFASAVERARSAGDSVALPRMLNMLATVNEALGDPHAALAAWQEALGIVESAGRSDVAPLHGGLCTAFRSTGELEQALRHCHAGVDVARRAKSSGLGFALLNLAALQRLLGEPEKAIPLYEQARDAFRPMGGVVELAALTRLAQARLEAGDVTGAAAGFSEALAFGRAHGAEDDPMTLLLAALAEQARGETAAAREGFEKALAGFRKLSDVPRTALALRSLADLDAVADPAKALERQREALALQEGAGDGDAQAQTLYGMALVHRGQGELAEARARIEAAIALVESLRGRLADPDLKATFLATRKDYYDLLADVLLRMHERDPAAGHDRAAFEANERGLTRSLLDLLAEARVDVRAGAEPELLERERRLREHVAAKAQRAAARGADAEMRGELERLLAEQARVLSELRRNSPRFASLVLPEPLPAPALQALLGPDELLLEFSLGRGGAVLYAVGARSLRAHRLKERERIDALARDLHALWAGPAARAAEPQARRLARELGQLLLAPVADLLAGKRLVIVADGVLVFVPFAALPSPRGGRPLVADHEIVHLPSLSALAQLRADRPSLAARELDVAVLADPVLSAEDARVAGGASGPASVTPEDEKLLRSARESFGEERLPRLPFTRREADAIAALVPDGRALKALDFAASRDLALSGELRRARFVHFATHGLVNARHPALSGLVLSLVDEGGRTRDGFLRLQDVYNTRLDAELVVLSGCRTALGREVRGEGLVGLTRGFFYAGAPRLVASLWDVRDRSAAELMRRLYEGLLKRGERPAQALRSAQLALLRDPAWSSPRHWAAFALHGDWR